MKKIALTSLLAVFAVSGAHAANVIDGNPLYMPGQNHFYSVTDLSSHSEDVDSWKLNEEFGYGILDNLAVNVRTALMEKDGFDDYGWGDNAVKLTFRALDLGAWKADVYGEYGIDGGSIFYHSKKADKTYWFDEDQTRYNWMTGIRGGYTTSVFTIAGHAEFAYGNTESFNWNDEGTHTWTFGLDGQYVLCDHLNLVAGAEYIAKSDSWAKNAGKWAGEFGVNYNIDTTKFVGLYVNGEIAHATGDWEWQDGFGFGAKFGIDF